MHFRYCCTEEEFMGLMVTNGTNLSKKELYENIVIKNRFRYEDLSYQPW